MKFAYFPGCRMPFFLPGHEAATRGLLTGLGVSLAPLAAPCCGFPARSRDQTASLAGAASVLAEAEVLGLDVLTPCKCCFGHLRIARAMLASDPVLAERVGEILAASGRRYAGLADCKHLLTVLGRDLGPKVLRERTVRPLTGLRLAAHYGCHALRPSDVTRFDDPAAPRLFEDVMEAAGAQCVSWGARLECCGNPLWGINDDLALALMRRKLADAARSGAHALVTACSWCQMQFEEIRLDAAPGPRRAAKAPAASPAGPAALPAVYCAELLGLALGLDPACLGLCGDTPEMAAFAMFCQEGQDA